MNIMIMRPTSAAYRMFLADPLSIKNDKKTTRTVKTNMRLAKQMAKRATERATVLCRDLFVTYTCLGGFGVMMYGMNDWDRLGVNSTSISSVLLAACKVRHGHDTSVTIIQA
jgi:hypothetical protein